MSETPNPNETMNNWKQFKNETPKEGQRIALGTRGFPGWVQTAPMTWPRCKETANGYDYWLDCTPPPKPSKMQQAWEALPDTGDEDWKIKPCGDLVLRHDFEFGFQQAEKAYGLKEGETQ